MGDTLAGRSSTSMWEMISYALDMDRMYRFKTHPRSARIGSSSSYSTTALVPMQYTETCESSNPDADISVREARDYYEYRNAQVESRLRAVITYLATIFGLTPRAAL